MIGLQLHFYNTSILWHRNKCRFGFIGWIRRKLFKAYYITLFQMGSLSVVIVLFIAALISSVNSSWPKTFKGELTTPGLILFNMCYQVSII